MKSSIIWLVLAVGLGACSSKEETPDPYASVEQFCTAWGEAACTEATVSACTGDTSAALTKACAVTQAHFCTSKLFSPSSAGYSSVQAAVCLKAVQAAYSDGKLTTTEIATVRHRAEPCNHLIKGPSPKGGSCTVDEDCDTLSNYECIIKGDTGTCQLPVVVDNGTACDAPDATCNPGFYCADNCVAKKTSGAKCTTDIECDPALICDPDSSKCVAKVAPDKCMQDSDCIAGNSCDIPVGASSGKCLKTIQLSPSEALCQDLQ